MPIGKNAIKRVENNGYSKVESKAPDMENSHVIAAPDKQVTEKLIKPVEKKAKKVVTSAKKTAASKPSTKRVTSKKTANKTSQSKDGFVRVELGNEMPFYLL